MINIGEGVADFGFSLCCFLSFQNYGVDFYELFVRLAEVEGAGAVCVVSLQAPPKIHEQAMALLYLGSSGNVVGHGCVGAYCYACAKLS